MFSRNGITKHPTEQVVRLMQGRRFVTNIFLAPYLLFPVLLFVLILFCLFCFVLFFDGRNLIKWEILEINFCCSRFYKYWLVDMKNIAFRSTTQKISIFWVNFFLTNRYIQFLRGEIELANPSPSAAKIPLSIMKSFSWRLIVHMHYSNRINFLS